MQRLFFAAGVIVVVALLLAGPGGAAVARTVSSSIPANVDISQRHLNESEESIAVNPTNPNNVVVVTNIGHREAGLSAGMFEGVSFDGGATWTTKLIGLNDNLGDACCDPSLSFDQHGNLFMTYLYQVEDAVPIALSTDGGLTFNVVKNISAADAPAKKASGDNRGLFRFVDQ
ncbi:MAG: sialidase family protein, partial [Rudaea sp.]